MILVVATCFFRKSHSIKCTTHPKTHKQPTTHKCHNPQPTKSKFPFSIMDEDCSQMLRDIRVQGPPRISRCKKVRDIRGLRANIPRISRKSARYPRGARYPRARSPRGYLVRDIRRLRDIRVLQPLVCVGASFMILFVYYVVDLTRIFSI